MLPSRYERARLESRLYLVNCFVEHWLSDENESLVFPTIEHLWHALKALDKPTFQSFATTIVEDGATITTTVGRFASFSAESFVPFFSRGEANGKFAYWNKKKNWGIIPKMVSNRKYNARLMLHGKMDYDRETPLISATDYSLGVPAVYTTNKLDEETLSDVWSFLLRKKYESNAEHRDALLGTGASTTLVEMARTAPAHPDKEFWGGYCKSGVMYGRNFMGQMVQAQRTAMLGGLPTADEQPFIAAEKAVEDGEAQKGPKKRTDSAMKDDRYAIDESAIDDSDSNCTKRARKGVESDGSNMLISVENSNDALPMDYYSFIDVIKQN